MTTTRTLAAGLRPITLCILIATAACGGDDDATTATPTGTEPAEPAAEPADETAAEPANEPGAEAPAANANVVVVTIGDVTYEIDVTPGSIHRCDPNFFGAFWALGGAGTDQGVELLLPPPGDTNFDDPPSISLRDDATGVEWIADPAQLLAGVEPGTGGVDEYTVDGATARGSATFFELNASYAFQGGTGPAPEPMTGTFEVTCADG